MTSIQRTVAHPALVAPTVEDSSGNAPVAHGGGATATHGSSTSVDRYGGLAAAPGTPLGDATPHASGLLKGLGIGLAASGGVMALASIPASAALGRSRAGMLFGGLGAAVAGLGMLTAWRLREDTLQAAAAPGARPGGGDTAAQGAIPATVQGVTGALPGVAATRYPPKVELKTIATDLGQLTHVASAPGDADGLWLVEKTGKLMRRAADGKVDTKLDISSIVSGDGERGLLSVAFHPHFAENGRLFIDYTDKAGNTHIAEAHAGRGGVVDKASLKDLMVIDQPYANHNGGQLQFGPDGMLYIGMGDGGSGGDPEHRAQDLSQDLGKLLRIDVDHPANGKNYGIPADNPFVGTPGANPEIYSTGVRNPWRFSFDRENGDLWMGDVGQNNYEEVDFAPRGQAKGANFGWNAREGAHVFKDGNAVAPGQKIDPTLEYTHAEGSSITGGYVYRGNDIPALKGYYVYSDIVKDTLRAVKVEDGKVVDRREMPKGSGREYLVSYGEGPDGELYGVTLGGELTKVVKKGAGGTSGVPGSGDGDATGPAHTVELGVQNDMMRFDKTEYHVKAGAVTLRLKNSDTSGMPHNIGISGNGINKMSDMAFTGDTVELTKDLEPGEYRLYCAPHMGAGMVAKLIVEE